MCLFWLWCIIVFYIIQCTTLPIVLTLSILLIIRFPLSINEQFLCLLDYSWYILFLTFSCLFFCIESCFFSFFSIVLHPISLSFKFGSFTYLIFSFFYSFSAFCFLFYLFVSYFIYLILLFVQIDYGGVCLLCAWIASTSSNLYGIWNWN